MYKNINLPERPQLINNESYSTYSLGTTFRQIEHVGYFDLTRISFFCWQLDVEQLGRVNGWKLSSAARRGISGVRVPRASSLSDAVLLPRTQHCCALATPSWYTDLSWWNPHHARRTACRTRWCTLPADDLDRDWWVSALKDCLFVLVQSSRPSSGIRFVSTTAFKRWSRSPPIVYIGLRLVASFLGCTLPWNDRSTGWMQIVRMKSVFYCWSDDLLDI